MSVPSGLLAIDVGNSQVKLGWFFLNQVCTSEVKRSELPIAAPQLASPDEMFSFAHLGSSCDEFSGQVGEWLDQLPVSKPRCCLASVHAGAAKWVGELLALHLSSKPQVLTAAELPIKIRVDEPEKVGVDRLLTAVAANRVRERGRPAIVVSLGTACTVNLIAADGAFEGGAILPGIAMSARALHTGTSALPLVASDAIDAPIDGIGKSTRAAISSGLIWGAVGAVHELIDRMAQSLDPPPQLFVTGGDAPRLASLLMGPEGPARSIPHMVLAGIHIVAGGDS